MLAANIFHLSSYNIHNESMNYNSVICQPLKVVQWSPKLLNCPMTKPVHI